MNIPEIKTKPYENVTENTDINGGKLLTNKNPNVGVCLEKS
jgi:hypothetical protein